MQKAEWLSQVRKGLLEYSILMIINNNSTYGYDLLTILNEYDVLSTTEGTIYPLLRRLEKNGHIVSYWKETNPGVPPRKYYNLTEEGNNMLNMMHEEWEKIIIALMQIKNKGD